MKPKSKFPISRIIGLIIIGFGIWMFIEDKEFSSSFDTYKGSYKEHHDVTINYVKVWIVGAVFLFFREILRYLDYVKYS